MCARVEDTSDAAVAAARVNLQEAPLLSLEEPILPHRPVHRGEPGRLPRPHLSRGSFLAHLHLVLSVFIHSLPVFIHIEHKLLTVT